MHLTTCFKILGLDPEADEAQAKRAYKAQVRRWHPDQFSEGSATKAGAEEQLKQINIAYARIKEYLANRQGRAATEAVVRPPQPEPQSTRHSDAAGKPSRQRSWVDHLFDTLNALAGGHNDTPSPASTAAKGRNRPLRFDQVLSEMAGGSISTPKKPRPVKPGTAAQRAATGYHRQCRGRAGVEAVGAAERTEPVKPVRRIRGIGRNG